MAISKTLMLRALLHRWLTMVAAALLVADFLVVGSGCISSGKTNATKMAATPVTPRAVTEKTFDDLRNAIVAYAHKRGKPPASLGALQGRWDSEKVRDGWGNEITYAVGADSTVRLWSFGSDKAIGGHDDAADIVVAFQPLSSPTATAPPLVSTPVVQR